MQKNQYATGIPKEQNEFIDIYSSAEDAVADIQSNSKLLVGGFGNYMFIYRVLSLSSLTNYMVYLSRTCGCTRISD